MGQEEHIDLTDLEKTSRKIKPESSGGRKYKNRKNRLRAGKIIARISISIATALLIVLAGITGIVIILEFGPSETARNLFVNSAMESSAGKFMATLFLSDETIQEIRRANSVVETNQVTDTSLLTFTDENVEQKDENVNVEQPDIEVLEIQGDTYKGKLMKVKDPSRVAVGTSGSFGKEHRGKTVKEMADEAGAVAAINGGGFEDINGMGNGGTPIGLVISNGKLAYGSPGASYEVIGFDNQNALVVGRMTAQAALDRGVRDAISFGPILIVNSEPSQVNGGGSGLNPRTAIGQCADGTMLLLTIDGRQVNSVGATYQDIIDIMLEHGAVNAANLDGGSSTLMYYDGEYINNCASLYGARYMPTCILVK